MKVGMSLECSKTGSEVFICGSDSFDMDTCKPIISAVSFDKEMEEITYLELHDSKMRNLYRVKRIEGSNAMLVSGEKTISVIEFRKKSFFELKELKNIHSGPIYSFGISGRDIYSVCPEDALIHKF
jgi:hypothetical protein